MTLARIAGFRLVTQAPERLLPFYAALGFAIDAERAIASQEMAMLGLVGAGTRWSMRLGEARVDLDRYDAPGRPYPVDATAASRCFQHLALVTDDVGGAWDRARAAGAMAISCDGPATLPASSGGVTAVKFRDPEGHPLELIRFPDATAKGWAGRGMLGIDHSAIVVEEVAASVAFYTARGLSRGEPTVNRGNGQATLDGVDDPVVDVVPMLPTGRRPHVELLHYRQPSGGPCGPVDIADVAATRIVWEGGAPALLRDPNGHRHQIGG